MGGVDRIVLCLTACALLRAARMGYGFSSLRHVVGGDGTTVLLVWGGEVEVGGYIFLSGVSRVDCHCFWAVRDSEGWMYTVEERYIERQTGPFSFSPTTPRWFSFPTDPRGSTTGTRQDSKKDLLWMGRWSPHRMAGAGAVRQPRSPGGTPNGSPDSQSSIIQPLFAKMPHSVKCPPVWRSCPVCPWGR